MSGSGGEQGDVVNVAARMMQSLVCGGAGKVATHKSSVDKWILETNHPCPSTVQASGIRAPFESSAFSSTMALAPQAVEVGRVP